MSVVRTCDRLVDGHRCDLHPVQRVVVPGVGPRDLCYQHQIEAPRLAAEIKIKAVEASNAPPVPVVEAPAEDETPPPHKRLFRKRWDVFWIMGQNR